MEARRCNRCYPGYNIFVPLPDPNNSQGKSEVMFINERPGKDGAGRTGYISFDNNDPSADFFRECFELTGLDREDVFITNACLCFPQIEGYTDTPPKPRELKNCHFWLEQQMGIVQPDLIVTIGRIALESVLGYFRRWPLPKCQTLLKIVSVPITDTKPWILPLCHTSRRGRINRSAQDQRQDWKKIPEILSELRR